MLSFIDREFYVCCYNKLFHHKAFTGVGFIYLFATYHPCSSSLILDLFHLHNLFTQNIILSETQKYKTNFCALSYHGRNIPPNNIVHICFYS